MQQKMAAQQQAQQAEYELQRQQTLAKAKVAEAEGDAQATLVKAKAQAEANRLLQETLTPMLVQTSVLMAIGILIEAALSFLGVGVRPPTPSLGLMLADGRGFMLQAPWMVVFPGLAVMLAVLGFNMLADGLRDWLDPQAPAGR